MSDLQDFLPIFSETLARIRARMDGDANAGVNIADPAWTDTREGSFYWDMTQVSGLEIARLWDAFTEAVAAAFPSTAWGEYLDDHGDTFGLVRNQAVAATATVLFTSSQGDVPIASNTQVSAPPVDPTRDTIVFQTTAADTTCDQLSAPAGVVVTPSGTGGFLTAATYIYHVTAYNAFGESTGSADAAGAISTSAGVNAIAWSAETGATGYRVYRTLVPNTPGQLVADVATPGWSDDGSVTPSAPEPTQNTSSGVRIPVVATTPGTTGNVGVNAIVDLDTPIPNITGVTNEEPAVGGADVESDEDFRTRLLAQYQGGGAGNAADYVRWSEAWGAERAMCVPVWAGPGTVLVVATLADGSPVADSVIAGLQSFLDPVPGQGAGKAPIGATVSVATSTIVEITISASVTHEPGYSLTGATGGIATQGAINNALVGYLASLRPGDTLVFQHALAKFFVPGVHSVSGLTINGGTADITLTVTPTPQIPQAAAITLS